MSPGVGRRGEPKGNTARPGSQAGDGNCQAPGPDLRPGTATAHTPIRTCVGCRAKVPQAELIRLVADQGEVVFDVARRRPGRGAWIHPDEACWALARKRGAAAFRLSGVERHRIPVGLPQGQAIQTKDGQGAHETPMTSQR